MKQIFTCQDVDQCEKWRPQKSSMTMNAMKEIEYVFCMFFNFWNENKNAVPITNKDEEKRRWEKQRENENHKTLPYPPPTKTLNQIIESKLDL